MPEDRPIFIRGMSRSGGTLLVTLLDAHHDIAMSYELYPDLLVSENGKVVNPDHLSKILNKSRNIRAAARRIKAKKMLTFFLRYVKGSLNNKDLSNLLKLRTFLLRCVRGGLNNQDLANLIKHHITDGQDFSDSRGRLRFIERCCIEKMKREGKSGWGLKCTNQYDDYLEMWPHAYFINIIRDGRDVLASQLNTGSFNKTPAEVAKGWVNTNMRFRDLVERPDVNAYEIFYEGLVSQPEREVKKMCSFLNISFNTSMLEFYKKDLTIYSRPTGHLSIKRITKPIDTSMVGRWKKDLKKNQIEEFYSVAKDTMVMFGYLKN
jgi:hypothetical protein